MTKIILASASPRRRMILEKLGLRFEVIVPETDESFSRPVRPADYVRELSQRKAFAVRNILMKREENFTQTETESAPGASLPESCYPVIIAADTTVVLNGICLGKPGGRGKSVEMLSLLSGKTHEVMTGLTVLRGGNDLVYVTEYERTEVRFAVMTPDEINAYAATGEPFDKAGGYAIQGRGALFTEEIRGDYLNVVGLPVRRLSLILKDKFGINLLDITKGNFDHTR